MEDLGACAVRDCDRVAQVDHKTFGLCVDHEGRRLAGDKFSVRQRRVYGGGVVSFIEFHTPSS